MKNRFANYWLMEITAHTIVVGITLMMVVFKDWRFILVLAYVISTIINAGVKGRITRENKIKELEDGYTWETKKIKT